MQIVKNDKPLNILRVAFDWRNIFVNDFEELKRKLARDRLRPKFNNFFFINWGRANYFNKKGNIAAHSIKANFRHFRILYDFLSVFYVPIIVYKHKFRPDIILLNDFSFVASALILKIIYGSKIVFLMSALPVSLMKSRTTFKNVKILYQRMSEALLKKFVDNFFAIGGATKDYLLNLDIQDDKIVVFPPDVIAQDIEFINNAKSGKLKERYNLPDEYKILLSVGRLESEKGFEDLIRSFSNIKNEKIYLIIAGEGSLRSNLEKLATESTKNSHIIFTGLAQRNEIWNFYKDADIFILLSKSEGLGLVFWEAMYMGVPVVGRRIGGIIDSIGRKEERGYFLDPGEDTVKLQGIIEKCLLDDNEVKEKKKRAKEYIEEKINFFYTINNYL